MNCDACASILDLYSEGRLSARWTARVKAHLERCPSCAAKAAALRPAKSAPASAPASLKEKLRRAAADAGFAPPPPLAPVRTPAALVAAAVVVLALLALNLAVPGPLSQRPLSQNAAVVWRLK